jgi:acetylserotonin O-methyltransferase
MSSSPTPDNILEMIGAFRRSKAMFTAVRLGIFDALEKVPQSAAELAATLKLNAAATTRLLDGCVALGLLKHAGDRYENTAEALRYLTSGTPDTLAGYIVYSDQSLFHLWARLEDAVREGSNRWSQVFGDRGSLFEHYFRDETATASFLAGMNGFGQISSPLIVSAFDLSRFRRLVDLGGATGHLAIAACEAYPQMEAVVLDLPHVEKFARAHIARSPVRDRVQFVVGDFFSGDLPSAGLYALGRILHDWGDQKISLLLSKIVQALPAGGGLLIAETLVNDDRSGPVYTLMQDLNMLVCTDGKERTAAEYRALLLSAGFAQVEFRRTGSLVDAILATKNL